MAWSALFDHTHIVKGVPVDADIELRCKKCRTLFYTRNAYYIGYSEINYLNPEEKGRCKHDIKELAPTKNWFPLRDIHKELTGKDSFSLFDYSHILEGVPIDADIELECEECGTLFYTKNAYYIGYSEITYANPADTGRCNHSLDKLKPTRKYIK